MPFNKYWYLFFLIGGLFLFSCKHEPVGPVIPPGPVDTTTCDPDTVYFGNVIQPLLNSSCAIPGCHDANTAEEDIILDSYSNIINTADIQPHNVNGGKLYESITDNGEDRMPPYPYAKLSNDQIDLIATWINQGALNNFCDESAVACDTSNVTFSLSVKPIIDQKCKGCHSGTQPQGGISLTNYDQIKASGASGKLLGAVNWDYGYIKMPQNASKIPDCEISKIRIWIADGMPNN